jgi:hypothetical protein
MGKKRAESIHCRECGRPGPFSPLGCPKCGEVRLRAKQRNHTLIVTAVACGYVGGLYGSLLGASTFTAILAGFGYAMVGVLVGVPIGSAINLTRGLTPELPWVLGYLTTLAGLFWLGHVAGVHVHLIS